MFLPFRSRRCVLSHFGADHRGRCIIPYLPVEGIVYLLLLPQLLPRTDASTVVLKMRSGDF